MVWVVSRFRLKTPPGVSSSYISPLTSSGQRSRAPRASQPQKSATLLPQPGGKPRKFIRTCGGIGEKKFLKGPSKQTQNWETRDTRKWKRCNVKGKRGPQLWANKFGKPLKYAGWTEVVVSPKKLVNTYKSTKCNTTECHTLNLHATELKIIIKISSFDMAPFNPLVPQLFFLILAHLYIKHE